jgi:hypothetical protein
MVLYECAVDPGINEAFTRPSPHLFRQYPSHRLAKNPLVLAIVDLQLRRQLETEFNERAIEVWTAYVQGLADEAL